MKLSVYLNTHYHYHQIKEVDSNSPGEIAFAYIQGLEEKVFQSPETVLRVIKAEALAVLKHYERLEGEVHDLVLKLDEFREDGPHLGEKALGKVRQYEEKRDVILEFLYSIVDASGYFMEFLLSHFSRADIQFPFLLMFKDFLPSSHYLRILLESGSERIWHLNEELLCKKTVKEKLNYWKEVYFDHFKSLQRFVNSDGTVTSFRKNEYSKGNLAKIIFNEFGCEKVATPALIPLEIFRIHFESFHEDCRLTSWFLHFNAELWAEEYYIAKFYDKESSPILSEFIESELRELTIKEDEATEKLLNKELDINVGPSNSRNYSLELKRIQSNYYHSHTLVHPHTMGGNSTVDIYAQHVFYKKYLEQLSSQNGRETSVLLNEGIKAKCISLIEKDEPLKAIDEILKMFSNDERATEAKKEMTLLRSELRGLKKKQLRCNSHDLI